MPATEVVMFKGQDGKVPILDWLDGLLAKVQVKCLARIDRLAELGHELRRPEADLLRDGIYELRIRYLKLNYRILYFFHDQRAILSHGLTKEDVVQPKEIEAAIKNKSLFIKNPAKHSYEEEE